MLAIIRRKLTRAEAVLAFQRANPSDDAALTALYDQLGKVIDRAKVLVQTRGERDNESRTSTGRRKHLRRRLQMGLLRLFGHAGLGAAKAEPALEERFRKIVPRMTGVDFAAGARSLVQATKDNLEKLAGFGVTQALVDEATGLLDQYDEASAKAGEGRNARIKARAELAVAGQEIMELITRLDGLNRHRLEDSPDGLAAWISARESPGPVSPRRVSSEGGSTEPPPLPEQHAA